MTAPLFAFTEEHDALRGTLRDFFADESGADSWRRLLTEVGADEIIFAAGDSGATAIDLAILAEEAGAVLFGGPLVSAVAVAGDAPGLDAVRAGARTPALAATVTAQTGPTLIVEDGAVCGDVEPVWDLRENAVVLADAVIDGEPALVLFDSAMDGVSSTGLKALDLSRPLGRIAGRATVLAVFDDYAAVRRRVELALAAELLGVAQHVLDATVEYVDHRVQFGRTIGSFQAIKHRLADLLSAVELTRSAVYGAAWALTDAPENLDTEVDLAIAGVLARDTATTLTRAAVQLHGGIAMTWEHWAHRYLRRAHAVVALAGTAAQHRQRMADLVDLRDGHHV